MPCAFLFTHSVTLCYQIEHLIQAADVAHMSQHWMIYRKWNERLFREMYKAFREGRSEVNPADGWYRGEIGFFDFYSKFLWKGNQRFVLISHFVSPVWALTLYSHPLVQKAS